MYDEEDYSHGSHCDCSSCRQDVEEAEVRAYEEIRNGTRKPFRYEDLRRLRCRDCGETRNTGHEKKVVWCCTCCRGTEHEYTNIPITEEAIWGNGRQCMTSQ